MKKVMITTPDGKPFDLEAFARYVWSCACRVQRSKIADVASETRDNYSFILPNDIRRIDDAEYNIDISKWLTQ